MAVALLSVFAVASCGDGGVEARAAERLRECMIGNGGVEASDVRLVIDNGRLERVTLSYVGQGTAVYDAVYEACLSQLLREFALEGG
jgi:hypothetical protein